MDFLRNKRTEKNRINERERLKEQIDDCLDYMKSLRRGFNEAADDELVSYYIYEKRAAEMKYHYLLGLYSDMMRGDGA